VKLSESLHAALEQRGWRLPEAARKLAAAGTSATGPIGVHGSDAALHLVQLASSRSGVRLRARSTVTFDEGSGSEARIASLRSALRRGRFSGRRAVAALEGSDVKLMVFDQLGGESEAEAAAVLRLVEERFDEPVDRLVIDYLPIRDLDEGQERHSALVAVAHEDVVIERLEGLRSAGLQVDALEIAPTATRRLVSALGSRGREENAMVLYAGHRRGHLIVLWGRRLVLYRELEFGADEVEERVAKALELDPGEAAEMMRRHGVAPPAPGEASSVSAASYEVAETIGEILKPSFYQLADQLERARIYTASRARGAAPDRAYLLGGFACWPGADRLLASLGPLPVHTLDPAATLGFEAPEADGEAAVAAGLALRGVLDDG